MPAGHRLACAELSRARRRSNGKRHRYWLTLWASASLPMIVSVMQRPWTDGNLAELVARYLRGDRIEGWEPAEHVGSRGEGFLVSCPGEGPFGGVTPATAMTSLLLAGDSANQARSWSDAILPDAWTFSPEARTRLDCLGPWGIVAV